MFSCEFPKTFITKSTARSSTATLLSIHMRFRKNTYQGQWQFPSSHMLRYFRTAFFWKSYFFTVFEANFFQSITRATFSEQLFLQSRYLFWGAPFSKQSFLSCIFSSENLPRNQTLKVGNSFVQLPFRKATHRTHLQKSYFFEADSSAQHQLFF